MLKLARLDMTGPGVAEEAWDDGDPKLPIQVGDWDCLKRARRCVISVTVEGI